MSTANERNECLAVRGYLDALSGGATRSQRVDLRDAHRQLAAFDQEIEATDDPLRALVLRQRRRDLRDVVSTQLGALDLDELENVFVGHAKSYGERYGVTRDVWQHAGVPPSVMRRAGL